MRLDPIATVEACYATGLDEEAWLHGILESLRPLDFGMGLFAETFAASKRTGRARERRASLGPLPAGALEDLRRLPLSPDLARRRFGPAPPVRFAAREARRLGKEVGRLSAGFLSRWGARDALEMLADDASGRALVVGSLVPLARRLPSPRVVRQLEQVSPHLVSGFRLRRALEDRVVRPDQVGRHPAETWNRGAREGLVAAVRRWERARERLRLAGPEEALALWKGLVDGTWSVLDHAEPDGRRFVLARRSQPGAGDPKALGPRERAVLAFAALGHQNKYIGYRLGLAPSTVAAHLQSACRKLGFASRREVIETFAPLVAASAPPAPPVPRTGGSAGPEGWASDAAPADPSTR